MHAGTVIDYRLRVRGFSVQWRSGITEWEPRHRFVEEQIRGRYRLWSICTGFNNETESTLARDDVRYPVLFDWLFQEFVVRPDVKRIFTCRADCLRRRFGSV